MAFFWGYDSGCDDQVFVDSDETDDSMPDLVALSDYDTDGEFPV